MASHTQLAPLIPVFSELFDKCTAATKARICTALVIMTTKRHAVQVRAHTVLRYSRGRPTLTMRVFTVGHASAQALLDAGFVPQLAGVLQALDQPSKVSRAGKSALVAY